MGYPIALLEVDNTLLMRDKKLNTALLESLLEHGVKDVYLFSDTLTTLEEVKQLIETLEQKGFKVHGAITPTDVLPWIEKDYLNGQLTDYPLFIKESQRRHEQHAHVKVLMLRALIAYMPEEINRFIIADDRPNVIYGIRNYQRKNPLDKMAITRIYVQNDAYNKFFSDDFEDAISMLEQLLTQKGKSELTDKARDVLNEVKKIGASDRANLMDLLDVLAHVHNALNEMHHPSKSIANARKLAELSTHISGKPSTEWKALGTSLLIFSCAVLVVIGVLAAIPIGGSSLLLSAIFLSASVGASATAALSGMALYHGCEKNLARATRFFSDALQKNNCFDPCPFAVDRLQYAKDIITLDEWNALDTKSITFDGVTLHCLLIGEYGHANGFKTRDALHDFLKKYLLKNVAENIKKTALNNLLHYLHQECLLNPVSTAATRYFKENNSTIAPTTDGQQSQQKITHFETVPNGFTTQEILIQKRFHSISSDNPTLIEPDKGKEYIYETQATVAIRFSSKGELSSELRSHTIKYGSTPVKDEIERIQAVTLEGQALNCELSI